MTKIYVFPNYFLYNTKELRNWILRLDNVNLCVVLVDYVISNNVKTLNNVIDLYIHAFADHKSTFLRVYCEKEEKKET